MRLLSSLRLAVSLLTAVPVAASPPEHRRAAALRDAVLLFPAVGLLVGGVQALVLAGALRLTDAPLLAAGLAVAAAVLLTRGFHVDGLADTADGMSVLPGRGDPLEVMRRADVGPQGVLAVVLVLLVQCAALADAAAAGRGTTACLVAAATARVGVVLACSVGVPAARTSGLGVLVAGRVPHLAALVAPLVVTLTALGIAVLDDAPRLTTAVAVGVGLSAALLVLRQCLRRLGGITGDVLGAMVEVGTAAALITLAV